MLQARCCTPCYHEPANWAELHPAGPDLLSVNNCLYESICYCSLLQVDDFTQPREGQRQSRPWQRDKNEFGLISPNDVQFVHKAMSWTTNPRGRRYGSLLGRRLRMSSPTPRKYTTWAMPKRGAMTRARQYAPFRKAEGPSWRRIFLN